MFYAGVSIYYAESLQTIPRDLLEVRPQVLLAVPRIYEKIYARVREQVQPGGPLRPAGVPLGRWSPGTGWRRTCYQGRRPRLACAWP